MFDWDEANIRHIAAHGVLPHEAEQVFSNDPEDGGSQNEDGEERYVDLSVTDAMRVLVVVTTVRGERKGMEREIYLRELLHWALLKEAEALNRFSAA